MPFQKGHPRYGGRMAKSKNKITREVAVLLDSIQCNPIEGLALLAMDLKIEPAIRAHCYAKLLDRVAPQLKAIELSGAIRTDAGLEGRTVFERICLDLAKTNSEERAGNAAIEAEPNGTNDTGV